ncbi:Two-component sensor histidine kinase, contains HisKA and HATPase domains [Faunimonas pinastri]|uniref:Blue-light-activated histidine kinase n=1 Tax=Faunimonas pinastri TaxID=1855383 RepID=A0A1H9LXA4_9HYPH|nr:PAS domain-containing sensor histidine kinase [Faunimonas pinastri]SER16096.1 Two-component sensor histidine kinase, contains HisKA and HATPase domains [Faunimonas pinastri]
MSANEQNDIRLSDDASSVALQASWLRCETALQDSRITIFAQDLDGIYTWIFNAPPGLEPSDYIGKRDREILSPAMVDLVQSAREAVLATGETREYELQLDGERTRWFDASARAERAPGGTITGIVTSLIDITDRKVQEEHLRILLRELAHRSKNLLAVIQGIARQTAESASSTSQFVSRFNGRIYSLSRAHDVLTDADWRGARIFDLVRSQIALYAEQRLSSVFLEGENGFLRPNAAQYIGLALHELTTNAIKYGALSTPQGRITVRFEKCDSGASYRFSWIEESSAVVREPKGRSFGLMMLGEVVPTSVSGSARLVFAETGLSYELDIPKAQLVP